MACVAALFASDLAAPTKNGVRVPETVSLHVDQDEFSVQVNTGAATFAQILHGELGDNNPVLSQQILFVNPPPDVTCTVNLGGFGVHTLDATNIELIFAPHDVDIS